MSDDEYDELMALFLKDTGVLGWRPPNAIISKPSDLTRDEKLLLQDLFLEYFDMPGQDSHVSFSPELYKEFFGEIFKYWVSSHRVNDRPILQDQTPEQTCIVIGTSLAESRPQATTENPCSRDPMPCTKVSRKRSICELIYLGMEFNAVEETFTWTWVDDEGEIMNSSRLQRCLPQGVTKNSAILMAIEHYDSFERKRITSYNREQIINAARRRIHKWARAGSSHGDTIDSSDKLGSGCILPLVLASDVYLRTARDAAEIAAEIKERRSMVAA
ncbi:hypothetical protein LCI18_008513 [Fusarium solani-melongenae]|uniref:Uncharacterized protein n=1 Tax=Fusarium solani subsp. cucurbitae TaxID=2747967 RepID=A0ACD3ZBW7_FUSSC|nr:hypothetical protein LCI18_008513 [Fusarium solani-melongenae]